MIRWICFIACLILAGCVSNEVEISSAALMPYKIEYEKPLPALVESVYAQKNSGFVSSFQVGYDSIGMSISSDKKKQILDIWDWNDSSKVMTYTTYGVPFVQGQSYRAQLELTNSIADHVTIVFDDYTNEFYRKDFQLSEGINEIVLDYQHSSSTLYDTEIQLIFTKNNQIASGQIVLNQLMIEPSVSNTNVKINQLGYLPESQKLAIFNYNSGDWFDVIDQKTNEIVYTGNIVGRMENSDTGEVNYYGDFSSVNEPGVYYIESQFGGKSYAFEIKENLYSDLLHDALKMITTQRCGTLLSEELAEEFAHENCHHDLARSYSTWDDLDASGGWHDAGDYGRYTLTAVKTMNDLMLAYYVYPDSFTDQMNLPESGNGIPDVLDEAKIGVDWLRKMQNSWGGVYTAAVTTQFADFVSPEEDLQQMWLLSEENTSTASAAGAFAMASVVFRNFDESLADEYLECAEMAYSAALHLRGQEDIKNPKEISAGDYANGSDADEIYFAAALLYAATHEDMYLNEIENALKSSVNLYGLSYDQFGGYGSYFLLKDEQFMKTKLYPDLYNAMIEHSMDLVWDNVNDGYHLSIGSYHWGANMDVCNNAMMMLLIHDIQPDQNLVDAAFEQLSYLLGKNSLNMSFVTGYGKSYPRDIHHRMAEVRDAELKGALVGGPDGSIESDLPPAKRYWDDSSFYTTNEVAIYYNSPLIFVLSAYQ